MKKIILAFVALAVSTLSYAGNSCNGFEIKLQNNLSENLLVRQVNFIGAEISPRRIEKLERNSSEVFVVNNATKEMYAEFVMETLSIPSKEIKISFELKDKLFCRHDDKTGKQSGGFAIKHDKSHDKLTYTIG